LYDGCILESLSVGAETVFASGMAIKQILSELKEGGVTMFLGIPLLFNKLLAGILKGIREKGIVVYGIMRFLMTVSGLIKKFTGKNPGKKLFKSILKKVSLDTNRICICGGGPLPTETFKLFNQLGIDFVQGYGLTETAPIICLNPVDAYKEISVGKVLPNCEMIIVDKDKRGIGEIAVKGDMVFKGYYKSKEYTDEAFDSQGYFLTGDLGYLDKDNYLVLTGRKKSLIVTEGGKNVYPEEIEDKFQLFSEIDQILIRGFKKDKGERIEALVYPNQDSLKALGKDKLQDLMESYIKYVNKELLSYQRIERVTVLDEPMEMTSTKKIKRHMVK
jgi:long-chain acyl-CoA synthetase